MFSACLSANGVWNGRLCKVDKNSEHITIYFQWS